MCVSEMKTVGAVELVLGLLDLSLGLLLHQVPTPFRKALPSVYIAAASTSLMGLFLVCGGHKPGYSCVRFNTVLHLPVVLFNAVAFGFLVRHVPFRLREVQAPDGSWVYIERHTTLLIGGLLIVLVVSFLLEVLVGLYLALVGWSVMTELTSQTQVPECSATTEPLCVELNQDSALDQTRTEPGLNQDSTLDQTRTEPGLNQDFALDQTRTEPELNQDFLWTRPGPNQD